MVEAINQAECAECDSDDIRQTNRDYNMTGDEETFVAREVRCRSCGAEGTVTISPEGVEATGAVSHENASWS